MPNVLVEKAVAILLSAVPSNVAVALVPVGSFPIATKIEDTKVSAFDTNPTPANASTNLPAVVSPNPEKIPLKTSSNTVAKSFKWLPQSIWLRNSPMPLPKDSQSVFSAISTRAFSKLVMKVFKDVPFSFHLNFPIKVRPS